MLNPIEKYRFSSRWLRRAAKAVDTTGYLWVTQKALPGRDLKKILLIRLDDLGDVILATPVIRNLKESFPRARIDMLVKSSTRAIVRHHPAITRVWELDPFWMRSTKPSSLHQGVALVRRLRKENYDLTFELRGNPFNVLLAFFIGGGHRVGYGAQGLGFLLHTVVPYEPNVKHEIERNLDLLRYLQLPITSALPEFFIEETAVSGAEVFLEEHAIHQEKLRFAIHPGGAWAPKCWPVERYAALVTALIERYRATALLLGDARETSRCHALRELVRPPHRERVVIAAGATTLHETAALIKSSRLFIGSDSGPLHIAHALRIPAVGLYGPQGPELFGPHHNPAVAIYRETECSPCIQKAAERCRRGLSCCEGLLRITPQDVLDVVAWQFKNL